MSVGPLEAVLKTLKDITRGSRYEGSLWLVGGYVRDKYLGRSSAEDDIDIVFEGDSGELSRFIHEAGVTDHAPVTYPRYGTAMASIRGINVELVTARRESYTEGSRKPSEVRPASLEEDARRRDFTINTLIENLHTGDLRDPLGSGFADLGSGIIRTPLAPEATFADDPLRMLRAIRFAARFSFSLDPSTWKGIRQNAGSLTPTVSYERIRDEFTKMLMARTPSRALVLLEQSGLLSVFGPELQSMVGVDQNEFHAFPVWEHTLVALDHLVQQQPDASVLLRLAVLLHDIGKPSTKSTGSDGRVHFYGHEDAGARLASKFLARLKFSKSDTDAVVQMVAQHMRIGEYRPETWTDAAVRRFVRSSADHIDELFAIHRADVSALGQQYQDISRAVQLLERVEILQRATDSRAMHSPLSGEEIMILLNLKPGREVGNVKDMLTDAVVDGRLQEFDRDGAERLARKYLRESLGQP